jgi:hypothetical protein
MRRIFGTGTRMEESTGMPIEIIGMVGTRDASEIKGPLVDGPVVDWMDGPVIDPTTWWTSPAPTTTAGSTGS